MEEFRRGLVSPKDQLVSHLGNYSPTVEGKLPQDLKARVAPALLMQVFQNHSTFREFVKEYIKEKELTGNHIEHELLVLALAIDSQVKSNEDFINTEACEILCRRVYGIRRAFSAVRCRADWQTPKGQGANKWRSKVNWALLDEIDMRALTEDYETIDAVEDDLKKRLEKKALMNKWMSRGLGDEKSD